MPLGMWDLSSHNQGSIEPAPPPLEVQSLNHWTTKEALTNFFNLECGFITFSPKSMGKLLNLSMS